MSAIADLYFALAEAKPPTAGSDTGAASGSGTWNPAGASTGPTESWRRHEPGWVHFGDTRGRRSPPLASAYEQWLDGLLRRFVSALEHEALEVNESGPPR